jgi:hypothetical protein
MKATGIKDYLKGYEVMLGVGMDPALDLGSNGGGVGDLACDLFVFKINH